MPYAATQRVVDASPCASVAAPRRPRVRWHPSGPCRIDAGGGASEPAFIDRVRCTRDERGLPSFNGSAVAMCSSSTLSHHHVTELAFEDTKRMFHLGANARFDPFEFVTNPTRPDVAPAAQPSQRKRVPSPGTSLTPCGAGGSWVVFLRQRPAILTWSIQPAIRTEDQ